MEFKYVSADEYIPVRYELENLIHEVQDTIRNCFTFQYKFIGSSAHKMITRQVDGNIGYDFDVDIYVNDDDNYSPKQLREKLINAFNKVVLRFGYSPAENSTRVITIKVKDKKKSKIKYSCDFCIVNDYKGDDGEWRQEYIRFNKRQNSYQWCQQTSGYYINEKIEDIKQAGTEYWNEVRMLYLEKKNCNTNLYKKSRSLFAETVNEIFQKYFE